MLLYLGLFYLVLFYQVLPVISSDGENVVDRGGADGPVRVGGLRPACSSPFLSLRGHGEPLSDLHHPHAARKSPDI